jgi:ketosteroid isomerase-like protein
MPVSHDGGMEADELFDAWERAWSGRDPAAFGAVCDPDVRYEDPLTPEPLAGPEAIAAHARRLWRAFPDARLNATGDRLSDGVHACAPCKLLGTHAGRLGRLSPTGRFLVVHAVVYAELRAGRLLRVRAFFDVYGPAVELGLLPRAGTAGERALLLLRGFGLRA